MGSRRASMWSFQPVAKRMSRRYFDTMVSASARKKRGSDKVSSKVVMQRQN